MKRMSDEVRSVSLPVSLGIIPYRVPLMVSPKGVVYDCIIWRMVEFIRMLSRLLVVRSKSTFVLRPRDNLETWQLTPTIRKPVAIVAEKLTKRYSPYAKLCNKKFPKQQKKKINKRKTKRAGNITQWRIQKKNKMHLGIGHFYPLAALKDSRSNFPPFPRDRGELVSDCCAR